MKIVITGSAGFVGKHLVKTLKDEEHIVTELDLKNGKDITDWNQLTNIHDFDILFHLAARTFVPDSYRIPRDFYYSNINSTLNALELCRINSAKIIYISSYVYGHPQYLPIDEKHPLDPFNPYAHTKIICEQLCEGYYNHFGVPVLILRPFNIYGIGQDDSFLIPSIISQAVNGKINLADPEPRRDFIFIDDVIEAYAKAVYYDKSQFEVINIGFGKSYSVGRIVTAVTKHFERDVEAFYSGEKRVNEIKDTVADITKAKTLLGWAPKIDMETGLKKIIESVLKKNFDLTP